MDSRFDIQEPATRVVRVQVNPIGTPPPMNAEGLTTAQAVMIAGSGHVR